MRLRVVPPARVLREAPTGIVQHVAAWVRRIVTAALVAVVPVPFLFLVYMWLASLPHRGA